ncbi:GNAT family N-acetyltransferase [Shewanella corallii]|uniref:GNAT family N-acetyltransferase n=1 Tax=Shewanella corallii TaxID=560080 RepID=A0ABT0NBB1_9GAMM|nr:GNAT family N-acetyltransferase [Shewanella corallii]
MTATTQDVFLKGNRVNLEPLSREHIPAMQTAVTDGDLWELWFTGVPRPEDVSDYIDKALAMQAAGTAIAFAVRDKCNGDIVGCTRICNWERPHKRLEIGYTWYAKRCWQTGINSESKLLLMTYAFETLGVIAVEFRTHWHNHRSRQAISRLGARQDGVLRNHRITQDGIRRDTVVFSIIDSEWAAVKHDLEFRLQRHT